MNERSPERAPHDGSLTPENGSSDAGSSAAELDQNALELAALYALSALNGPEMEALEREQRGRTAFWDEVRSLRDAAAGLAEAGPRARPSRDLWPAIRAQLAPAPEGLPNERPSAPRAQIWKDWRAEPRAPATPEQATPEHVVVPEAGVEAFEATGFPGVRVRRLAVDEHADRVTMLIRMEPGTSYPAHRHGGAEECFVVQGDLEIGSEIEMHAGDFQRMESGSSHAVQSTRGGCLLLVTSSRHDELLA